MEKKIEELEESLYQAYKIIQKLEKENQELKDRLENYRRMYVAQRDCYEEFE